MYEICALRLFPLTLSLSPVDWEESHSREAAVGEGMQSKAEDNEMSTNSRHESRKLLPNNLGGQEYFTWRVFRERNSAEARARTTYHALRITLERSKPRQHQLLVDGVRVRMSPVRQLGIRNLVADFP